MWRRHLATRLVRGVQASSLADLRSVDLSGITVLSLDVFDTCLGRAVLEPTDIFECLPSGYQGFRVDRMKAESGARAAHPDGEPNLDEIYSHLDVDDDLRAALQTEELSAEAHYSRARGEVLQLARRAADAGISIAYLSDMYLSSRTIRGLLDRHGFPSGEVLVSNELCANKASGGAFDMLVGHFGVPSDQVLHVGDNLRSDGIAAHRAGIHALVVERAALDLRRPFETFPVQGPQALGDSIALGLATAVVDEPDNVARSIGRVALGPAQLAFTLWVRSEAQGDPALFCSRDMYAIEKLYNRLATRHSTSARSSYLHISRRAVGLPALAGGIAETDREFLVGGRGGITEHELWNRIGIDSQAPGGGTRSRPLLPDQRDDVWQRMLDRADLIVSHATDELSEFVKYWRRSGLPEEGHLVLVDVGWRATVQRSLTRCLALAEIDAVVRGRYFGLLASPPLPAGDTLGWIVDRGLPHARRVALESGIPVVELAFQAAEGSVERYAEGLAVTGTLSPDRTVQDELQAGAAQYFDEWLALDPPAEPTAASVRPLLRLLNSPRPEEARALGSMPHTDRLGTAAALTRVLPEHVSRRVLLPTAATRRQLRSSEWRPGVIALAGASTPIRRVTTAGFGALKKLGRLFAERRQNLHRTRSRGTAQR